MKKKFRTTVKVDMSKQSVAQCMKANFDEGSFTEDGIITFTGNGLDFENAETYFLNAINRFEELRRNFTILKIEEH